MGNAAVVQRLVSIDGGDVADCPVARPERLRYWAPEARTEDGHTIPRGAGLSYAGASFGAGATSVSHARFDRLLSFDAERCELKVEAGATLWAVQTFLAARGLYLPCHPGHGRITVGGCVGVDAHGKNQRRDGTFMNQVVRFELFHPDHGHLVLDREREPEIFELTCGGYGLTGHILTVTLRAAVLPSDHLIVMREPFADTAEGFAKLADTAEKADFTYTWHDLAQATGPGGGYVFSARFGPGPESGGVSASPKATEAPPLTAEGARRLPVSLMRAPTLRAINGYFRLKTRSADRGQRKSVIDALFPVHGSEIYFALFGRPGLHEYQMLTPLEAAAEVLETARARARHHGVPFALCSCKRFGGARELLRFTGDGVNFALNFPRMVGSDALMADLDALTIEVGGLPNLAKDSRLSRAVMEACYAEHDTFRSRLAAFDPKRRMRSGLSERLGL
ncbi:MAG: FAD-binding oxidoreductase [Pseudomonadota bacterium]